MDWIVELCWLTIGSSWCIGFHTVVWIIGALVALVVCASIMRDLLEAFLRGRAAEIERQEREEP